MKTTGSMYVDEIDILDCAVFDTKLGVIGSSHSVDVELSGLLDKDGFVFDFSDVKKQIKKDLKETLDHALLVPKQSQSISLDENNGYLSIRFESMERSEKTTEYHCPKKAVYLLDATEITTKALEREAEKVFMKNMPSSVTDIRVTLREEQNDDFTFFRYTHGLPGHKGLCQRLLHGHRSSLRVFLNGERRKDIESDICTNWFNNHVHIAEPSQMTTKHWNLFERGNHEEICTLKYQALEGEFALTIPAESVFLVEKATSIESISQGIAKQIKLRHPDAKVKVMVSEGINKGGLFEIS